MANTVIQLKYSTVNATPASLNVGEPAYSFQSNKLFIGNSTNHVLTIGGKYYTDLVDAATDTNTSSAIVKRDASGNFSAGTITAALSGNASTATKWQTARNIGVSGDATGIVSVDGSANANIPVTLTNTGVSAGVYGSSGIIPVINVAANGRVLSVTNVAIGLSASLTVAADTGSNVIVVGTDTLTFVGGDGITSSIGPTDNVRFDVDNTVFRTTGGTIIGDVSVTGNLNVTGTTSYINVTNYQVEDTLIYLGANNYTSDILDIGFAANYDDGTGDKHVGIIRKAGTNDFYIFTGYNEELSGNNTFNVANPSIVYANTHANLKDGKLYNVTINDLAVDLAVKDGGTGRSTFTTGAILIGAGTGGLNELANVTVTKATLATSNTVTDVTTDGYGRITAVVATPIAIDTSQVTSGTLPIARGGTNQTTFTGSQLVFFNGTSLASIANTGTAATYANASHVPVITTDAYGRVSSVTNTQIAISATQVTSGTLAVDRGGTGLASYTTGDLVYASGTTTLAKLAGVATGNALISGGVGAAPSYGKIGLTTHITGTLAVGNGGTGNTALTSNHVLLGQGTNAITTVGSSTEGHILTINASGVPEFMHLSGGTF